MDPEKKYLELKEFSVNYGFDFFGVADVRLLKSDFVLSSEIKEEFNWAISLGKKLLPAVLEDIVDHPTPLYFHHYRQINFFLDRGALALADFIQTFGAKARALPIPASQVIDWENQRAHLSHKKIGALAGLGWLGRNNLLINPEVGAQFRLVTLLINFPLKVDSPLNRDCENCYACLSVCPARAIKKKQKDFDHWACFEKLKEFRQKGYVGQYICGICVKACSGPK